MYTCLKWCIQHTVFSSIWSHISGHLCWTSQSIKDILLKRAHGAVWFHQDVLKRAVLASCPGTGLELFHLPVSYRSYSISHCLTTQRTHHTSCGIFNSLLCGTPRHCGSVVVILNNKIDIFMPTYLDLVCEINSVVCVTRNGCHDTKKVTAVSGSVSNRGAPHPQHQTLRCLLGDGCSAITTSFTVILNWTLWQSKHKLNYNEISTEHILINVWGPNHWKIL